jgi:hypothetical protein
MGQAIQNLRGDLEPQGLQDFSNSVDPAYQSGMFGVGPNGGGGKKGGGAPPDYMGIAKAQAAAQKDINAAQTWANRPDISGPMGGMNWQAVDKIDPSTGKHYTSWEQNLSLDPQSQQALDAQQQLAATRSQGAAGLANQAVSNLRQPLNTSGMTNYFSFGGPQIPGSTPTDYANQAMEATWAAQQPQLKQRREQQEAQLANQGITRGSEAWNQAQAQLNSSENAARLQAYQTGAGIQQQMFNQGQTAANQANQANIAYGNYAANQRQQQITEEQMMRNQPLADINALTQGQGVQMPSFPGFNTQAGYNAPDLMGAANNQYTAMMNQQQMASQNAASLASAAMAAYMAFSDARIKQIICRAGKTPKGFNLYFYKNLLTDEFQIGVIAQEVQKVLPSAVHSANGILCVNYAEVV